MILEVSLTSLEVGFERVVIILWTVLVKLTVTWELGEIHLPSRSIFIRSLGVDVWLAFDDQHLLQLSNLRVNYHFLHLQLKNLLLNLVGRVVYVG